MNLEDTSASLASQLGDSSDVSQNLDRIFSRIGKVAFGGLLTVGLIGVLFLLYTIVTKMILTGERPAFGAFMSLFIVFATLALVWVYLNEARKSRPNMRASQNEPGLKPAETSRTLTASTVEPIPSVVEDTTELLRVPSQGHNRRRD